MNHILEIIGHLGAAKAQRSPTDDQIIAEHIDAAYALASAAYGAAKLDPRDPDPSRSGIFRDHNCAYCSDGAKPCRQGNPNRCDNPRARND